MSGYDSRIHTWADGYGRWHALVPATMASPIIAARGAIRRELEGRSETGATRAELSAYVRENITQRRVQSEPGYVEFVEYELGTKREDNI